MGFRQRVAMVLCLAGFVLAGCGNKGQAVTDKLVITGSSTVAPLVAEMAKAYEKKHPTVRIDVQTGGSSRGIEDARRQWASIGMVSRALTQQEADLHPFTIARDGIALIVHKDNPVSELSKAQIQSIYTGEIKNWQALGWKDRPITVVHKAEGRSTLELFLHYFQLKNTRIQADVIIGDNEQGVKTVAGNPYAVGYVSIGTAAYDHNLGVPIRLLPMNGVAATIANVENGSFPLSRQLNMVTREPPQGSAKKFIEYAMSPDVNPIIRSQYFVPPSR